MKRKWIRAIAAMLLLGLISACTSKPEPPEEITLTILYGGAREDFQRLYGEQFAEKYPHITVNVIDLGQTDYYKSGSAEMLIQLRDTYEADIIQTNDYFLGDLIKDGKLVNLDTYIKSSNYDLSRLYPPVVDLIRQRGGGELYGLSPYFGSSALYYNKSLFDQHGIDYPTDGMSWFDVLQLAMRFPTTDGMAGIYHRYDRGLFVLFSLSYNEGLRYSDSSGRKLVLDSPEWKRLWGTAMEAYRSGALKSVSSSPLPGKMIWEDEFLKNKLKGNLFAVGKSAMVVTDLTMVDEIKEFREQTPPLVPDFDWDIVTRPVSHSYPDALPWFDLHNVYAISTDSPHQAEAWELIRFMHGEESAKAIGAIEGYGYIPTMTSELRTHPDKNMEAFFKLKKLRADATAVSPLPKGFILYDLANKEIDAVLSNQKTAEEALMDLQLKGQEALDAAWRKQEASGDTTQ